MRHLLFQLQPNAQSSYSIAQSITTDDGRVIVGNSNVFGNCYGFSIRPHLWHPKNDPVSGYTTSDGFSLGSIFGASNPGVFGAECALPPGPGPLYAILHYKNGHSKHMRLPDNGVYRGDQLIENVDIGIDLPLARALKLLQGNPASTAGQANYLVHIFETVVEQALSRDVRRNVLVNLFPINNGAFGLNKVAALPASAALINPIKTTGILNVVNYFGVPDNLQVGTTGGVHYYTVGGFFIFEGYQSWRMALGLIGASAPQNLEIWSLGGASAENLLNTGATGDTDWKLNEIIDAAQWQQSNAAGAYYLTLERTCQYAAEWIAVCSAANSGQVQVLQATAIHQN